VQRLERALATHRLTIADSVICCIKPARAMGFRELARNPQVSWNELFVRSPRARHMASEWLFKTRNPRRRTCGYASELSETHLCA